ncbi:MAG: RNA methyltransferase [Atopobium sp.]|uniref:TrmH family RNA methyltransferase n=1 Tax=Atopobium sp. TaxID=1872650 RepID=UPI002A765D31|nr:RNA methyltransferase [Atopobium sp.]MDY2788055.1 RNA methyltransferase [Atopobium sp.]
MPILRVHTLDDSRLEVYTKLTQHQLRNAIDPERGIMIVESEIAIRVALAHGLEPLSLLVDEKKLAAMEDVVAQLAYEVPVFVMPHALASELVGYKVTRGTFAAMRRPAQADMTTLLRTARRVAVLEGIVDSTNVGALFRSAAALNVDAVLLSPECADPFSRRSIRVSMGNVFLVPHARFEGVWPLEGIEQLHAAGFTCAALALSDTSLTLDDPSLKEHERLALFFGTEGDGLTHSVIDGCDVVVRIPMAHGVDSLNVAAASAVAFWELCR